MWTIRSHNTTAPYVSMGRIMTVYNHSVTEVLMPHSSPISRLHFQKVVQAIFNLLLRWMLQFGLLSSITPKYLTSLASVSSVSNSLRGLVIWYFLLLMNNTSSVLLGFTISSWRLHHSLIIWRAVYTQLRIMSLESPLISMVIHLRSLLRRSAGRSGMVAGCPSRFSTEAAQTRLLVGSLVN